jgi:HNH endonuclease
VSGYTRKACPLDVKRKLRQETGFGCAKCGHPYLEYHHIIPWAEEQHFRTDDMLALCGNCHPAVAGWEKDRQYELKRTPHNVATGITRGALEYKRDLIFKIGGNWYENASVMLQYFNTPIISCKIVEGQTKISLCIMDNNFFQILVIDDNEIVFRADDLWDFQYSHRMAVARYGPSDIALRIDFRGPEAKIEGKFWLGNSLVQLGQNETVLPGYGSISGSRFAGGSTAILIGDPDVPLPSRCMLPGGIPGAQY